MKYTRNEIILVSVICSVFSFLIFPIIFWAVYMIYGIKKKPDKDIKPFTNSGKWIVSAHCSCGSTSACPTHDY